MAILILIVIFMGSSPTFAQEASLDQRLTQDIPLTTLDGRDVSLKQCITSRATVINFTTTWCSDCKELSGIMNRLIPEFQPQGIDFIFIYVGQRKAQLEQALGDAVKSDTPLRLLDVGRSLSQSLSITSVPTLFMVDDKGNIRFEGFSIDEDGLSQEMTELLR